MVALPKNRWILPRVCRERNLVINSPESIYWRVIRSQGRYGKSMLNESRILNDLNRLWRRLTKTGHQLPAPTPREQELVEELRAAFKRVGPPVIPPNATESEAGWLTYCRRLYRLTLQEDPRAFLRW